MRTSQRRYLVRVEFVASGVLLGLAALWSALRDLLGPRAALPHWRVALGVTLVVAGTAAAFTAGELIASGRWLAPWAPYRTATGAFEVGLGLVPLLGLAVAGLALL